MGDLAVLVVRRVIGSTLVLFLIVSFVFVLMRFAGDPVYNLLGPQATQEAIDSTRERLGLDQPVWEQFREYWQGVLRGDFGDSLRFNSPALPLVLDRFPATALLGLIGMAFALIVAIPMGIAAALRPGSMLDNMSRIIAVLGQSMPEFWFGILLIILFAVRLNILPAGGTGTWQHLVLPAVAISFQALPMIMRLVRSSMLETISEEYVKALRAKGLRERIIHRHALRNAIIPVVTVVALRIGHVLAGLVVLEEVFAYPGVGRLAIQSMVQLDYTVIQAFIFLVAVIVIGSNLLADILYGVIDPRIRTR